MLLGLASTHERDLSLTEFVRLSPLESRPVSVLGHCLTLEVLPCEPIFKVLLKSVSEDFEALSLSLGLC